jgi:hypothetical protein
LTAHDRGMTDLTLIWLSAAGLVAATIVVFVILARSSAGESSAWSIAPGVARGVAAWAHRRADLDLMRLRSPRAEEPGPPIDFASLPFAPIDTVERGPEACIEDLVTRRLPPDQR